MLKSVVKSLTATAIAVLIIANSSVVIQSVKEGLLLCYNSVIPSLYIFMVLSKYISGLGNSTLLSFPFSGYSKLIKIKDRQYSVYLILSLLGGFAVGATFLNEMKKRGYPKQALYAAAPTLVNNSLSFCVMAVGAVMLGNIALGLFLFISQVCASLITGFILSFIFKYNIVSLPENSIKNQNNIVDCINSSVTSILSICGFVVLFYSLCQVVLLYIKNDILSCIFTVFTEITCGCSSITNILGRNIYFICFAISIMPISTLCQVYYFTQDSGIIKTLLYSRILHTPVCMLIFSCLINFFPVAANVISPQVVAVKYFNNTMEISGVLFMISLCFIYSFENNKLFTKFKK